MTLYIEALKRMFILTPGYWLLLALIAMIFIGLLFALRTPKLKGKING